MPLTAIRIKQKDKLVTIHKELPYGDTYPFLLHYTMNLLEEIDQANIKLTDVTAEHVYFTNEEEQLWVHEMMQRNDFYRLFVVSRKVNHKFLRTGYYLYLEKQ